MIQSRGGRTRRNVCLRKFFVPPWAESRGWWIFAVKQFCHCIF